MTNQIAFPCSVLRVSLMSQPTRTSPTLQNAYDQPNNFSFFFSPSFQAFDGIQFLPLDKNTYLRVQCFINLAEATFPSIKYSVFMYNDHVVWSGLEQDDMRILYKYLTGGLLYGKNATQHPSLFLGRGVSTRVQWWGCSTPSLYSLIL